MGPISAVTEDISSCLTDEKMSASDLKQKRGRQLGALTRLRRQAFVLIDSRGSRSRLTSIFNELDITLGKLQELNDEYCALVSEEQEKTEAAKYIENAETQHKEAVDRIEQYLQERKEEPPSVTSTGRSRTSAKSSASRQAEITAKVKKLETTQLERRLELEKKEQELKRERLLQEAKDAEAAAELEAHLIRAAEDELSWERKDDFEGETETRALALIPQPSSDPAGEHVTWDTAVSSQSVHDSVSHPAAGDPTAASQPSCTPAAQPGTQDPAVSTRPVRVLVGQSVAQGSADESNHVCSSERLFHRSLPRLTLPTFDGNPGEWVKWFALFRTLVHDQPTLTPTEKMAHLQSAVTGLAQRTIEGMLYRGELYEEAIKVLKDRFGRESDIIHANLNRIFSCPSPAHLDPGSLEKFHATVHCAVSVFQSMGHQGDLHSYENLRRVVEKLPIELKKEWGEFVLNLEPEKPSLIHLDSWLGRQVRIALNFAAVSRQPGRQPNKMVAEKKPSKPFQRWQGDVTAVHQRSTLATETETSSKTCVCCKERHDVTVCPVFLKKTVDDRAYLIADAGCCFFCLQTGHGVRRCKTARPCGIDNCKMRHHQVLHGSKKVGNRTSGQRVVAAASLKEDVTTLLQVVPVTILGSNGKSRQVCALLDPGSQTSLVVEDVLEQLDLHGERQALRLQSVEGTGPLHSSAKLQLELEASNGDGSKIVVPEVFSVKNINVTVPELPKKKPDWKHLQGLNLSDCSGKRVELLIGANVIEAVLQLEVRTGEAGQPVAIRTIFGWTLVGSVKSFVPERTRQVMLISKFTREDDMSTMLQEWWTTESFGSRFEGEDAKSPEDIRAVKIMEETTRRLDSCYETGLLWKTDDVRLPESKKMAVNRLQSLEKSLLRHPLKAEAYKRVIEGYVEHGYARKLTPDEEAEENPKKWHLPHHGVTNPRKPEKLRVVFDAAAECGNTSLNDALLTGPDLLKSLPGILLRFREHPVALTADIECMYHQVRIIRQDQPALRFLWRDLDVTKEPEAYSMQVAIFGARSSPASASFVLQKTARDCSSDTRAGRAAQVAALTSFYMDDFVHASKTEEEAAEMHKEVTELLRRGGFRLTKWMSSSPKVMERIDVSERAQSGPTVLIQSVLGCTWDAGNDTLGVRSIDARVPSTKRGVVQGVARLFDPMGLVSPFSLQAKILIQRLWAGNYGWDDELEGSELRIWKQWLEELPALERVTVPRCFEAATVSGKDLHIFCDASQDAFGAVAYITSVTPDDRRSSSMVMSRTRVAPLRQISIVRLELQAAVLGVRMANVIQKELSVKVERVRFWTDSTVVLQYVRNDSRRYHTFVANRVAEVRESSQPSQWKHVPSSMNAADVCSRGASVAELASDSRWVEGPEFLLQGEEYWPEQPSHPSDDVDDPEVRKQPAVLALSPDTAVTVLPDAGKFSSWTRYRRVVAWMIRFVRNFVAKNCQKRADWKLEGPLSAEELRRAEMKILADCQARCFSAEITKLRCDSQVKTDGKLQQMSPFLDDEGLMRVGGRVDKAPVDYSTRHPVILPSKDDVTRLIVTYSHAKVLHSGQERTLTEVRKSYWILKARSTVRRILFRCTVCKRRRANPQVPRMADLPTGRFDTSRPFSAVGVDYFGPMLVKKYRKTEKRYGVLFTCLSTRAVHLEVANSLDTDSFIMALRRFIARRGQPDSMYSDNGTNFVGGERELRQSLQEFDQARIVDELSREHTKWTFLPPSASHMGGVWERLVGCVKRALRVVLGTQCVTDEVLHTALLEVEAMVNGRPLTYVSSDSTDFEPLTPNHLLLGCANVNTSPAVVSPRELNSRRRWRQSQVLAEHFWKRWRQEYVPTLLSRHKWLLKTRNLRVGDVVLMMESDTPRGFWPLARVVKVFPGDDDAVRSVELRSAGGGTYHRPVAKVCLLEETE